MEEIITKVFEDSLYYKDKIVLKYKIEYPQIIRSSFRFGSRRFNEYNYNKALELKEYCENEIFKDAKEAFDSGYNQVITYEVIYNYEITYNQNGVLSLYTDEYIYAGGAHGSTKRESQNWNLKSGRMIILKDLYSNNPYYILDIIKQITKQIEYQIKTGQNQYFDNYCCLVQENLKYENFYLTENGIAIFFNQYEIAPYSSGIPTFIVKV